VGQLAPAAPTEEGTWQRVQRNRRPRRPSAPRKCSAGKAQALLSTAQIADQLRALASQVEAGTFALGDKEVELPTSAEFEISYKLRRKGGHQIEVEIEWGSSTDAPLLPTE
jgi:amphi-Trp domain-containing protein